MASDDGSFWDVRYANEGEIWGHLPSPTALVAGALVNKGDRLLDVGFGYGRDLAHFIRQGCRVYGIDLSVEGRIRTKKRLQQDGLSSEALWTGRFEEHDFDLEFDIVHSHRVAHLLVTREAIEGFARRTQEILHSGGLLCIGARNRQDLDPDKMVEVDDGVFEYRQRPGHRIRYWDDRVFTEVFGSTFEILHLDKAIELESVDHPVPCHFSVMIGRKN